MKNFLIFLGGGITGFILAVFILVAIGKQYNPNPDLVFFDEKAACVTKKPLKVFQALETGYALARPIRTIGSYDMPEDPVVLLANSNNKTYYDDERITIPYGKCARQVGTYKYEAKNGNHKTVPIVEIMN